MILVPGVIEAAKAGGEGAAEGKEPKKSRRHNEIVFVIHTTTTVFIKVRGWAAREGKRRSQEDDKTWIEFIETLQIVLKRSVTVCMSVCMSPLYTRR